MATIASNDSTLKVNPDTASTVMSHLLNSGSKDTLGVYESVRLRYVAGDKKTRDDIDAVLLLLVGSTFERITERILKTQGVEARQ